MMQVDNVMCVVIDPCQANGDDDCENKTEQETRKQAYEWALAFGNGLRVACGKGLERIQISQTQLDELRIAIFGKLVALAVTRAQTACLRAWH